MAENLIQFIIPSEYVETYKKLLNLMVYYGIDLMKDCQAGCDSKHRKLIECWNVFQSACAAHALEYGRESTVLYSFVTEQLNLLYGEAIPSHVRSYRTATEDELDELIDDE